MLDCLEDTGMTKLLIAFTDDVRSFNIIFI